MNYDHEDLGVLSLMEFPKECEELSEAFKGSDVVVWSGSIERQLVALLDKYRKDKDSGSANKVDQFLQTWRAHKITGSLNRTDIQPLETAASQLAVDSWHSTSYFGSLRDQLRRLLASEEELPRIDVDAAKAIKSPLEAPPEGRFAASDTPPKDEPEPTA